MPDVPERCPYCNSGDRREETWQDKPAYSFSCGTVFHANGEVALRYFPCYAREKEQEERAIREQLAAARAEAERWRKQYEALRETVVGVVLQLTHGMINDQQAEAQLRAVLTEAGGGSQ